MTVEKLSKVEIEKLILKKEEQLDRIESEIKDLKDEIFDLENNQDIIEEEIFELKQYLIPDDEEFYNPKRFSSDCKISDYEIIKFDGKIKVRGFIFNNLALRRIIKYRKVFYQIDHIKTGIYVADFKNEKSALKAIKKLKSN